jgi:hypothetical protein
MNPPEAAAVFVLAITAYASGPLIAPRQRTPHPTPPRPTPSWARSRTEARRIARATRTRGVRP